MNDLSSRQPTLAGVSFRAQPCVVVPEARPDVCGRDDLHSAQTWVQFDCGCRFTYCKHALVILYGRSRLTSGVCPVHGSGAIIAADRL